MIFIISKPTMQIEKLGWSQLLDVSSVKYG